MGTLPLPCMHEFPNPECTRRSGFDPVRARADPSFYWTSALHCCHRRPRLCPRGRSCHALLPQLFAAQTDGADRWLDIIC